MINAFIQFINFYKYNEVGLFMLLFSFSLIHFFLRYLPSKLYKPIYSDQLSLSNKNSKIALLIPVVDETIPHFKKVLKSSLNSSADYIHICLNGDYTKELSSFVDDFSKKYERKVKVIKTAQAGKRNAIYQMYLQLEKDVEYIAIQDSDTIIETGTLTDLALYLEARRFGGVMAHQEVSNNNFNYITRFANFNEKIRNHFSAKAYDVLDTLPCLPGRLILIKKSYLGKEYMERFIKEKFLGVYVEFSDDRTLTNYIIEQGGKAGFYNEVKVKTLAPTSMEKFWKQQLRWSRGSQYNNLRMLLVYLKNKRFYTFYMLLVDMLMPLLYLVLTVVFIQNYIEGVYQLKPSILPNLTLIEYFILGVIGSFLYFILKYREVITLKEYKHTPSYLAFFIIFRTIDRLYGFATMALDSSWGTRVGGYKDKDSKKPVLAYLPIVILILSSILVYNLFKWV